MNTKQKITLSFPECPASDANKSAAELKVLISDIAINRGLSDALSTTIEKQHAGYQDFGTTLGIILGSHAAIVIAKGVHDFISARGHRVIIKTENGEIIATGDAARNIDIAETVKVLQDIKS